jgi:hypothetical protein
VATFEEYLAQGVDPGSARAWSRADDEDEEGDTAYVAPVRRSEPGYRERHDEPAAGMTTPQTALGFGTDPGSDLALREVQFRLGPAPHPVTGRDSTGMVGVHVDRQHTPQRLELRNEWDEAISARVLETSIFAAYRAALDTQYQQSADDSGSHPRPEHAVTDYLDFAAGYFGVPRSPAAVGEDVRAAIDRADRLIDEMKDQASRRRLTSPLNESPRTIKVELDGHLMSGCHVNAQWATQVTAGRLMDEFFIAVQRAREESASAESSPLQGERDALIAELNSLARESLAELRYLARG